MTMEDRSKHNSPLHLLKLCFAMLECKTPDSPVLLCLINLPFQQNYIFPMAIRQETKGK